MLTGVPTCISVSAQHFLFLAFPVKDPKNTNFPFSDTVLVLEWKRGLRSPRLGHLQRTCWWKTSENMFAGTGIDFSFFLEGPHCSFCKAPFLFGNKGSIPEFPLNLSHPFEPLFARMSQVPRSRPTIDPSKEKFLSTVCLFCFHLQLILGKISSDVFRLMGFLESVL